MDLTPRLLGALCAAAGVFVYLVAAKKQPTRLRSVLVAAGGALLVLAGLAMPLTGRGGGGKSLVVWTPYTEQAAAAAVSNGQAAVIDFYADWCVPCHDMERTTYADPRVAAGLEPYVRLKADLTDMRSAENEALIEKFNLEGLPAVVFLDPQGKEIEEARIFGYASAREFLAVLNSPVVRERTAAAAPQAAPAGAEAQ